MKTINLARSVYDLTEEYPELIEIMISLGFMGIKNPIMRNTVGRTMTLKDGSKKMGIPLEDIIAKLKESGFEITDSK